MSDNEYGGLRAQIGDAWKNYDQEQKVTALSGLIFDFGQDTDKFLKAPSPTDPVSMENQISAISAAVEILLRIRLTEAEAQT